MKDLMNALAGQASRNRPGESGCNGIVSDYDPGTYMCKVKIQPDDKETGWLPIPSIWTGNQWGLFCPPTVGDLVEVEFVNGDFESGYSIKRFFTDSEAPISGIPSGEFWLVHATGTFIKLFNDGHMEITVVADLLTDVEGNHVEHIVGNENVSIDGSATKHIKGSDNITIDGSATVHVKGNATVNIDGNATVTVGGTLNSSATQWNHTGPFNLTGNMTHTGNYTGNGTVLAPYLVGSINVTFAGIPAASHKHSGVSTGVGNTGNPV